ncbi:MAG: ArsR family transcriptional regulator [Actinomycetota bacterium]|nr:ArsR family transcriptional regulator [Actinomycetota bacterium]
MAELAPLFHLTQPTISHHLKVLKDAGVVGSQREGIWACYYLEPGALDELAD